MLNINLNNLQAFTVIADEGSFTRAAGKLGVTTSALSHNLRELEEQMGVRLLIRTTRSVTTTEAGERLLQSFSPMFRQMEEELDLLSEFRDKPAGHIRLTVDEFAAYSILLPAIKPLLHKYPDIKIGIFIDYGLTDIAANRFDGGIRFGSIVDKDMISFPVSKPMPTAIVASPAYFRKYPKPRHPKELSFHSCLCLFLPTYGGLYAWELEKNGQALRVKVSGQLTFNTIMPMREAALDGLGIAFLPRSLVISDIESGALEEVLPDWLPVFESYHFYYSSRKHKTTAFNLLLDALKTIE